ncbi:acetyltransferase [Serratia sp. NPDC078593]|uniref:acetyltransferase n=1 Tax=unclassified Serratia (in: enterobacteria) TaxID=2647522 RepID=UPI0037D707DE
MITIKPSTAEDYPRLVTLWLNSVRATHHFITEAQLNALQPLVANDYLPALAVWCAQDSAGHICGFIGMNANKVEMLFIDANQRGKGIGKALLAFAATHYDEILLDVNEQNPQAVGFYQHYGFKSMGRSERDGQGNPFPLLHMKWNKP